MSDLKITQDADGTFLLQKQGDAFRLALFTDLHIDMFDRVGAALTRRQLRAHVRNLKPDLVALLGDSALNPYNKGRTRRMVKLLDQLGVPWTAVLGNHEGDHALAVPRDQVIGYYKASRHFYGNDALPGVSGWGNQCFRVELSGKPVQLLCFLDSGGGRCNDGIQPDQLDFFTRAASPPLPAMLFFHVPPPQYQTALAAVETGQAKLVRGKRREPICTGGSEAQGEALIAAAKAGGAWAMVCGHDHSNDFDILYDGLHYVYAQSGGFSFKCYDKRSIGVRGCTNVVIQKDGEATLEQHHNRLRWG
ncbi:MAG: metallophosphoesterase [Oscillospiraceae bacterium]|jgi:hypothetical protein|nr:metallophosphoesterase [Oscillospiraceae bacterium]